MRLCHAIASLSVTGVAVVAFAAPTTTPTTSPSALHLGPIPDGLGVNIHFTDPQPGEMQAIADAGFTWVRMDFVWQATERERGVYDFSAYDRLFKALDAVHIRPIFILNYGNPLYDPDGASPHTDASREAMAKWAVAAVTHFKDRGAVWEMWNEPNIGFWKPKRNVDDYVKLALTVADAIRAATPNETLVGPGCSGVDLAFLEACFKAGLLARWDAVSLHPYRQDGPESVALDYAKVRGLIARYAPPGKDVQVISSEWGYSAAWHDFDDEKQADMLAREWLTNLANGVPISIWYDWRDDGESLTDPEHHFGVVRHAYTRTTARLVYEPKPAFLAAQRLTACLRGFHRAVELDVGADVRLLLFSSADDEHQRLAVWTTGAEGSLILPVGDGAFDIVDEATPARDPWAVNFFPHTQAIRVTHRVQYLMPHDDVSSDLLRIAAAWEGVPSMLRDRLRDSVTIRTTLRNPLDHPITVAGGDQQRQTIEAGQTRPIDFTVKLTRSDQPLPIRLSINVEGVGTIGQRTQFVATNPLRLSIEPSVAGPWSVRIENPSGEAFAGRLAVYHGQFSETKAQDVRFGKGEFDHRISVGLTEDANGRLTIGGTLKLNDGAPSADLPRRTFARFGSAVVANGRLASGYTATTDGDAKVAGTAMLAIAAGPMPNTQAIEVHCTLGDGWKFAEVHPPEAIRTLGGKPRALLLWVWSDGSGFSPRLRFTDSGNETFQPIAEGGPMTWTGWRLLRFALDGSDHPGHWGGDGNGAIDYPIRLDTLLLLDKPGPPALSGTVRFAGPVVEYE